MIELIYRHPDHFLFIVLLIARVGDILTTYIATPNLKLEANPLARRFRWPFALLTILTAFIAYWDLEIALAAAVMFLLVCASNASKMWLMRGLGEDGYGRLVAMVTRNSSVAFSLACFWAPPFFFALIGVVLFLFTNEAGQSVASGILIYAFASGFYTTLSYFRGRSRQFT